MKATIIPPLRERIGALAEELATRSATVAALQKQAREQAAEITRLQGIIAECDKRLSASVNIHRASICIIDAWSRYTWLHTTPEQYGAIAHDVEDSIRRAVAETGGGS